MNNGKVTPCRKTGPPCGCKKNCYSLFSDSKRASIISEFSCLGDKDIQDSHLFGLVGRIPVQRRRARNGSRGNRSFTYTYKVFQYYSCMNSSNVTILFLIVKYSFHR